MANQRHWAVRLAAVMLASFALFHAQDNSSLQGPAYAVAAMACLALGTALQVLGQVGSDMDRKSSSSIATALPTSAVCLALLISISLAWSAENVREGILELVDSRPLLLALNVFCNSLAIELGGSLITFRSQVASCSRKLSACTFHPAAHLTMAGLTAVGSQHSIWRDHTPMAQVAALFVGTAFLTDYRDGWFAGAGSIIRGNSHGRSWMMHDRTLFDPLDSPLTSGQSSPLVDMNVNKGEKTIETGHSRPVAFCDADEAQVSASSQGRRVLGVTGVLIRILMTAILIVSWSLFFYQDASIEPEPLPMLPSTSNPSLDRDFVPETDFDVVISMYREPLAGITAIMDLVRDIPAIAARSPRLIIYTKDQDADLEAIQGATDADEVVKMGNYGREGGTYLHHILTNWDTLASQTFFTQAGMHDLSVVQDRLRYGFDPQVGMLSIGFDNPRIANCNEPTDEWEWQERPETVQDVYKAVSGDQECESVLLSYKGQFMASAARIRGVDKSVYEDTYHSLVNPLSWMHGDEYTDSHTEHGFPDSLDAPYYGFTLERMWCTMMQCSDPEVGWTCPLSNALDADARRFGYDCLCYDDGREVAQDSDTCEF